MSDGVTDVLSSERLGQLIAQELVHMKSSKNSLGCSQTETALRISQKIEQESINCWGLENENKDRDDISVITIILPH